MSASFPASKKSFSAVTNGVTKLVAALFNSAYDEIEAIETRLLSGSMVQLVNTQTGAVATGSTALPDDDTIPQITEGDEYMTLAITPTSATNKLKIDVTWIGTSGDYDTCIALFQDTTANALAATRIDISASANNIRTATFSYYMTAGTTSATTFKVRAGSHTGTVTFNGMSGSRKLGGVMASSITITEISA